MSGQEQIETASNRFIMLGVVALVGLNLRPFITGIGPLATGVRAETGLGAQGIALLTLVPMLLMGILAFAGPSLQARIGATRAVIAALAILAVASFLRLFVSTGLGMVGTAALLGLGAAVAQAVFPGIVKRQFPHHVGLVMGLYSSMLMGGGALGAQLAPLIATASGDWHFGLAWVALPALIAVALAGACLPGDAGRPQSRNAATSLLKRPRTWLLMGCFGLVNGGYSTSVAWLAPYYQEQGWTNASSGGLLALMAVGQALAALLMPALAGKSVDRRPWLWLTLAMQAVGFAGLILQPGTAPFALALLLGAGLGGSFSLTMIVALEHLPDPAEAGALSAMMQGGGFLIAAIPPWIVAVLHDTTGGFRAGWLLHLACIAVVTVLTFRLAPDSYGRSMRLPAVNALA